MANKKNAKKEIPDGSLRDVVSGYIRKTPDFCINIYRLIYQYLRTTPARVRNFFILLMNRASSLKNRMREDRKQKKYRSFHLQKRIKPEPRYIPSSRELLQQSVVFLWKNKKLFLGIMMIYAVIYAVLIRTPFMTDAKTIIATVQAVLGEENATTFSGNLATLGAVLSTSSTGENAVITSVATLVMSLVYIWAIRQRVSGQAIRVRDAYFQSMTPLLSFIIVLLVISVQMMPLGVGSFVYTTARGNNLFATGFEDLAFFIVTLLLGLLSLYWIASSIVALYAVSLPGVYPIQALAIAKKLTKFQRFTVFKRIIALPITLGVIYIGSLLLIIRFAPDYILYVTEGYQIIMLPLIHAYLYKLYRTLI